MAALNYKLKKEINAFEALSVPAPTPAIKKLFDVIVETAEGVVVIQDREVDKIYEIARDTYIARETKTQKLIFKAMKNIISIFGTPGSSDRNRVRLPIFARFLEFYFNVVFCRPGDKSIRTEASQHALQYIKENNVFKYRALRALKMSLFDNYPIGYFEKGALKNLLIFVTAKIDCEEFDHNDTPLPYIINFLHCAIEKYNGCGFNTLVCKLLGALFKYHHSERSRGEDAGDFSVVSRGSLFSHIISHIKRDNKDCWLSLSVFLKRSFKYGDVHVKYELIDRGIFGDNGIKFMFRRQHTSLIEILEALEAAILRRDLNYMDIIVNQNLMAYVMPYVDVGYYGSGIREKARKVVTAFFTVATPQHMLEAARNNLMGTFIDLLRSKNDHIVMDAEKWLVMASDVVLESGDSVIWSRFRSIIAGVSTFESIAKASSNANRLIREGAEILLCRFQMEFAGMLPPRETGLLKAQSDFILDNFPA